MKGHPKNDGLFYILNISSAKIITILIANKANLNRVLEKIG